MDSPLIHNNSSELSDSNKHGSDDVIIEEEFNDLEDELILFLNSKNTHGRNYENCFNMKLAQNTQEDIQVVNNTIDKYFLSEPKDVISFISSTTSSEEEDSEIIINDTPPRNNIIEEDDSEALIIANPIEEEEPPKLELIKETLSPLKKRGHKSSIERYKNSGKRKYKIRKDRGKPRKKKYKSRKDKGQFHEKEDLRKDSIKEVNCNSISKQYYNFLFKIESKNKDVIEDYLKNHLDTMFKNNDINDIKYLIYLYEGLCNDNLYTLMGYIELKHGITVPNLKRSIFKINKDSGLENSLIFDGMSRESCDLTQEQIIAKLKTELLDTDILKEFGFPKKSKSKGVQLEKYKLELIKHKIFNENATKKDIINYDIFIYGKYKTLIDELFSINAY